MTSASSPSPLLAILHWRGEVRRGGSGESLGTSCTVVPHLHAATEPSLLGSVESLGTGATVVPSVVLYAGTEPSFMGSATFIIGTLWKRTTRALLPPQSHPLEVSTRDCPRHPWGPSLLFEGTVGTAWTTGALRGRPPPSPPGPP